jgi:hypothetical protein
MERHGRRCDSPSSWVWPRRRMEVMTLDIASSPIASPILPLGGDAQDAALRRLEDPLKRLAQPDRTACHPAMEAHAS